MNDDEHIIEAIGRTRIVVRDGRVVEVGDPLIRTCPLAERFGRPVREMTKEAIRENIEERIRSFGMCTPDREVLATRDFVLFGASELISCAIRNGLLDCAVIACDGAGTLVAQNPALVQGIGGRMSGLVKTSPIPAVIERIEANGGRVLDPATAAIDQAKGVAFARDLGCRRVAVTVAGAAEAEEIRRLYPESLIVAVHTTGLSAEESERLVAVADIVTVCASRHLREAAGRVALLQGGAAIPVFALTREGKDIILEKIRETDTPVFVKGERLPVAGKREPEPLI
jgi:putative methanogenesis marker protein 8